MYLDLDWPTVAALVAGVLLTGAIGGTLAGLLGIGGGIVVVPVLFWLLELLDFPSETASHIAVATSLATIVPTSISSVRARAKSGTVDTGLLKVWGPSVFIGALIGGILSRYIPGEGLRGVFGIVGILVAINMVIPKTLVLSDHLPSSRIVNGSIAGVIGFIASLMGVGGGSLAVPALSIFGYPVHKAMGTAAAMGLLIALPATAGFIWAGWDVADRPPLSLGYVNLAAVALIAPVSFLFAPLGARLAQAMNARYLKIAFGFFLLVTAIQMLIS